MTKIASQILIFTMSPSWRVTRCIHFFKTYTNVWYSNKMKNKKYLRNSSNIESENRGNGNGGKIDTPNTCDLAFCFVHVV